MMLAGTEAIAARVQPPGKGGNIVSLKNCQKRIFTAWILGALVIWD